MRKRSLWVSAIVRAYVRHSPLERGKWRLLNWTRPYLVAKLEKDVLVPIWDLDDMELGLLLKGIFEPQDVEFFTSLLETGMTVMDLGANLGMYTLLAARRVGPSGRVFSFEPSPAVAARLRRNLEFNSLSNVIAVEAAVGDQVGEATFYLQEESDRNTLAVGSGKPIHVPAVTLDSFVDTQKIGRVDVMKMDVEGAESKVLRGGGRLFSSDGAPVVMFELNPKALEA